MIDVLSQELLESMKNRRTLFGDLTPEQQQEFIGKYHCEVAGGVHDMSGEFHQAFLGSVHGLVISGVRKVRQQHEGSYEDVFGHRDALHDSLISLKPELCVRKIKGLDQPGHDGKVILGWVMGKAWSVSSSSVDRFGGNGVVFPKGLMRVMTEHGIREKILDIQSGDNLSMDEIYRRAVKESGSADFYADNNRAHQIGRAVWKFACAEPIEVEHITDDMEWEHRLDVESDWCDDELVGLAMAVADTSQQDLWHDAFDANENRLLVDSLPWDELSDREIDVVHRRFGLGAYYGHTQTQQEIGDELGLTKQRIQQIEELALSVLLDPVSFPKKVQCKHDARMTQLQSLVDHSLSGRGDLIKETLIRWNITPHECAEEIGVRVAQLKKWIQGEGMSDKTKLLLAEYLDIKVEQLM
jgi:hypothetical protein